VTVDTLERCAANLEAMRLKFLTMGGSNQRLTGAFQSNFLFLVPQGVMTASSYEGPQWTLLVRSGDGRLVNPAAMPQQ
jgi:hypothetical protein